MCHADQRSGVRDGWCLQKRREVARKFVVDLSVWYDLGGALTCYNSAQKSYYLAGIVSIGSAVCGDGNGGQSVKIAKYLQWIKDNTVPGDVVTPANGATLPVGGGTGDISVSLFIPSLPSASEATVSSVASTAGSVEPLSGTCGVPGDGTVDPFGLASQFRFGLFRKKLAVHPNAIGGEVIPPTTVCWQVRQSVHFVGIAPRKLYSSFCKAIFWKFSQCWFSKYDY